MIHDWLLVPRESRFKDTSTRFVCQKCGHVKYSMSKDVKPDLNLPVIIHSRDGSVMTTDCDGLVARQVHES